MSQALDPIEAMKVVSARIKELVEQSEKFVQISRIRGNELIGELQAQNSPEFFSTLFIRRNAKTGFPEERFMVCSFNIEKFLVGGSPKYDPNKKDLWWVCDMQLLSEKLNGAEVRSPHRSINKEGLMEVTIRGIRYKVAEEGVDVPADRRLKV